MPEPRQTVHITIDGQGYDVPAGELVIKAAQDVGVYIPRFCWHERMKPVAMCRMCLVEIEGQRGLPPACYLPVQDGMVVHTQTAAVKKAQEGVLEFLLVNHPLDCPVCDRGGECPLQDHTLAFGPGESRFVEEKRHFPKPIAISPLVDLDRERCIQCARCTRFAEEIAGDPLITFVERGDRMQVLTYPDEPFTSYFSGNTVQICPVGALTARPYRFRSRPWDLETVESSCQQCAVGCRVALQSSSNRMVRMLGVDSEAVNHGWLCDRGRFGFEWVHAESRVVHPTIRRPAGPGASDWEEVSWPEALDRVADILADAVANHGPDSIALIGGARGTNEDAYAWARLAKGVLGTDNVDCQLGDGLPAEVVLGLERATLADCDRARAIVLLAPDVKEELPVLYLRLRRAALELGVPLIDVSARDHGLSRYARVRLRHRPGEAGELAEQLVAAAQGSASGDPAVDGAAALLAAGGDGGVVVVLGRPSVAESAQLTLRAAAALARLPGARFLSALRRGNVHGALDMGLAPGMLPGRVSLDAGRDWFASHWAAVPAAPGLDTEGILRAAEAGRLRVLVILGSNPVADFPDRDLALRALERVDTVVAVGGFVTGTSRFASVVLPTALYGEKDGTTTNLEGRVLRLVRKITPAGTAMADWRIAVELAHRLDADFDLESVRDVQDEIARVAPAYAGVDAKLLVRARDGVAVPLGREPIVVSRLAGHRVAPAADADPGLVGGQDVTVAIAGRIVAPADAAGPEPVQTPGMPALHEWDRSFDPVDLPALDSYAYRLVVGHTLYDEALAVTQTPHLAGLPSGAELLVSPSNLERLGVEPGQKVRITSSRGSVVLPVKADPGVPKGVAFLPLNQPGSSASDLVEAGAPVTDVRVETIA